MAYFFKQKTAYEIMPSLVGSEMCIRDSHWITVNQNIAQSSSWRIQNQLLVLLQLVVWAWIRKLKLCGSFLEME